MNKINSSNIGDVISSFKDTVESDSVLYIFEESEPLCMSREYMFKEVRDSSGLVVSSIYKMIVLKYLYSNTLTNHYYKNKDGVWVNIDSLKNKNTSASNIYDLANNPVYYEGYKVDSKKIPPLYYMDRDGRSHPIPRGDGTSYDIKPTIFINEFNSKEIYIEQCNIDSPSKLGEADHLKNDLKVVFKKYTNIDNILVWLNGIFVGYEKKNDEDNVIYIRSGKEFLTTLPLTVDENGKPIYYYRPDLRIFKWKDLSISQMIPTRFTKYTNLSSGRYSMSIVNEVYFEEEIKERAHMIFCNGQVLSKKQYKIDKENPKHIYLTSVKQECEDIINELKNQEEFNGDPFALLGGLFKHKVYTLINFDSEKGEEIHLEITKPLSKGFPGKFDVLFRQSNPKDLILVDGLFFPYLISRAWHVSFPIESHIYMTKFGDSLQECDIYKVEFMTPKTTIKEEPEIDPLLKPNGLRKVIK